MVLTVIMIVIACFFAVYLRLFTEKELWYEMFAAVLGVIITAVITMILLKGQTENDTEITTWTCTFAEGTPLSFAYKEIINDLTKDIEKRILMPKSKNQFKQNVQNALNKKNAKHKITQIGIKGMIYLEPTYDNNKKADITTNLGIENENHTFNLVQEDKVKLTYVFSKGDSQIEKTQSYEE